MSTGLLLIYHLSNDSFTNKEENRDKIAGSQGSTLNINIAGVVPIFKRLDVVFVFASPIVTRQARPDGLTRKFVAIAGLKFNIF